MLNYRLVDPAGLGGGVLHPQIAEELRKKQDNPQPRIWQVPLELLRGKAHTDAQAEMRKHMPEHLANTQDLLVPTAHGTVPARLYTPLIKGPYPVWLFIHGGGFVWSSVEDYDAEMHIISLGVPSAVLSVDYHLSPEARFPVAVEECMAAYQWVLEHGSGQGLDPTRVAVGGDSAGGNLAAVLCLAARQAGLPQPALQVLIYPSLDQTGYPWPSYEQNGRYGLNVQDMNWVRDQYLEPGADVYNPLISPICATDFSNLAPALVQTAEFDVLCDEGEEYARRLAEAGVPTACSRYLGVTHGFAMHFFELSRYAMDEIIETLRKVLVGT